MGSTATQGERRCSLINVVQKTLRAKPPERFDEHTVQESTALLCGQGDVGLGMNGMQCYVLMLNV